MVISLVDWPIPKRCSKEIHNYLFQQIELFQYIYIYILYIHIFHNANVFGSILGPAKPSRNPAESRHHSSCCRISVPHHLNGPVAGWWLNHTWMMRVSQDHPMSKKYIMHQCRSVAHEQSWLVVSTPLKHWSVGMIIPNTSENKKCSKPPTRVSLIVWTSVGATQLCPARNTPMVGEQHPYPLVIYQSCWNWPLT